jgi:uncharacterized protein YqgC (DUF456 family)
LLVFGLPAIIANLQVINDQIMANTPIITEGDRKVGSVCYRLWAVLVGVVFGCHVPLPDGFVVDA